MFPFLLFNTCCCNEDILGWSAGTIWEAHGIKQSFQPRLGPASQPPAHLSLQRHKKTQLRSMKSSLITQWTLGLEEIINGYHFKSLRTGMVCSTTQTDTTTVQSDQGDRTSEPRAGIDGVRESCRTFQLTFCRIVLKRRKGDCFKVRSLGNAVKV